MWVIGEHRSTLRCELEDSRKKAALLTCPAGAPNHLPANNNRLEIIVHVDQEADLAVGGTGDRLSHSLQNSLSFPVLLLTTASCFVVVALLHYQA